MLKILQDRYDELEAAEKLFAIAQESSSEEYIPIIKYSLKSRQDFYEWVIKHVGDPDDVNAIRDYIRDFEEGCPETIKIFSTSEPQYWLATSVFSAQCGWSEAVFALELLKKYSEV